MKVRKIFKNIILFVVLTMFSLVIFSFTNNISIEGPEEYHYQDTRSEEQRRAEGNYFVDEHGNIIQPTQEEMEVFSQRLATIKRSEKVIEKHSIGKYRMHEHFEFEGGLPSSHGETHFYQAGETPLGDQWSTYQTSNADWDPILTKYHDTENYNDVRNVGAYHMRSHLEMNSVDTTPPNKSLWVGNYYAFLNKTTNNPATVSNESLSSINTDYNENNGTISYSATIQDSDDHYRNYGVSINGGPIEILKSSQEINRIRRTSTQHWRDEDPLTGKHVNFNINKTFDNIGAGTYSIQLHGQKHVGNMDTGWENIGTSHSEIISTNSDAPSDPTITNIEEISKPRPNGGNQGQIKIEGTYKFANDNTNYKVTKLEVSKDAGLSWDVADVWSESNTTWYHTFKDLVSGIYNFKIKLTHNGYPTIPVINTIPYSHVLLGEKVPGASFDADYVQDSNYIKASEGKANGEITFSGNYEDDDQIVTKVETTMSFDGGSTWTTWEIVNNSNDIANSFQTKLIGIPEGQVLTKARITYNSGPGQGGIDTVESSLASFMMGVFKDPLLDETNSPITLTSIEADYNTTNKSSIRIQVALHDPDDQIKRVQVKYQIVGSNNWVMKDMIPFTTSGGKKIVDYTMLNLTPNKDYEFKMNVELKRTNKWIESYVKIAPLTTIEQPIEATVAIGIGTKPSKWGLNDGKVSGTVTVPSPTNNSTVTGINAYLKKTNDSSYNYIYPQTISANGITNIEFIGTDQKPIIPSDDYYIEIVYDWKSNSGITYPFTKTSGTIMVDDGDDFPLEAKITNIQTKDVTLLGAKDGTISFDYEVINLYNSDISEVKIVIEDEQGVPIEKREKDITSEALWSRSEEFKFLGAGIYRVKILSTYEINESGIVTDETLFESRLVRLSADNFIQPSSTHTVVIAPYKINVVTNIEDPSNVILQETLIITIEINGEIKYQGNEMNVDIHYNEDDIIWYDVGVQADIELPDGKVARWDGKNILEKVDQQLINEENNVMIILISIVISLLLMLILTLVLIKKVPSIKWRLLK